MKIAVLQEASKQVAATRLSKRTLVPVIRIILQSGASTLWNHCAVVLLYTYMHKAIPAIPQISPSLLASHDKRPPWLNTTLPCSELPWRRRDD